MEYYEIETSLSLLSSVVVFLSFVVVFYLHLTIIVSYQ